MKTTALWLCLLMTPWIPQGQPYTEDDGRRGSSRSLAPLDDEESDFSGDASYVYVDSHRDNPMYYPKEGENVYRPGFLPKESDLDKIQYNDPLEEIDEIKPAMLLAQGDENGTYTQEDILDEVRRKLALDDAPTDQYIYDPYDSYDPYDYYGEEPEETTTITQALPPTMKPTESPMTTTTPAHTTSTSTTTSSPTTIRTPVVMSTTKPMSPSHKVPAILPEERVKTTTMSRPVAPATESMDDTQTEPIFDSDDATKALPFMPLATTEEPLLITKPKVPPAATTAKLIISTKTTVKPTPELEPAVPTYEEPLSPSRRPSSSTAKFSTTTRPTSTTSTTTVKTLTSGTGSKSTTTTASSTTTTTTRAVNRVVKNTVAASERSPHEPSLVATTKAAILQEANTAVEGTGGPGVVPQNSQFSMIVLVICVISFVIVLLAVLVIIFLVRARLRRRGKYDISSEVESEATNGSAQNGKAVKFQEETDKKAVVTVQYNNSAA